MKDNKMALNDDVLQQVTGGADDILPSTGKYNVGDRVRFTNVLAWPADIQKPLTLDGTIVKKYDHHPILSGGACQHFYDIECTIFDSVHVLTLYEQRITMRLA